MHTSVQVYESYFNSDMCSIYISDVTCVSEAICIKFSRSVKEHSS